MKQQAVCRISGEPLVKVVDFGQQPLGNGFLLPEQFSGEYFFPMETGFSESSMMFQLFEQPAPEQMFHEHYAFYSSTSSFMERHFAEFAQQAMRSGFLTESDPFVVELGCNDGIMLKNFVEAGIRHLGIWASSRPATLPKWPTCGECGRCQSSSAPMSPKRSCARMARPTSSWRQT